MLPKEREYGNSKIARCAALWAAGKEYQLLLEITGLTEDAETLTVKGQPEFVAQSLYFRDHLRAVMESPLYRNYVAGKAPAAEVFKAIEKYALEDMKLKVDLARLAPPRNLLELRNYVDRTKWQYYKSTATRRDFRKFLLFAQYDRRYLRAAARTTRKLEDAPLENHNLPMALLFREALAIKKGNKLAAVGLIDEAVRIPFAWVKALPRRSCRSRWPLRISSCRGIKRTGSDKSRHWNVFGGISLINRPSECWRWPWRGSEGFQGGRREPARHDGIDQGHDGEPERHLLRDEHGPGPAGKVARGYKGAGRPPAHLWVSTVLYFTTSFTASLHCPGRDPVPSHFLI